MLNEAIRLQAKILAKSEHHPTVEGEVDSFEKWIATLTKFAQEHPKSQKHFLTQYEAYCKSRSKLEWMMQRVSETKRCWKTARSRSGAVKWNWRMPRWERVK